MTHRIHDGIDREMTADEIVELDETRAELAAKIAAIEAAAAAKVSARAKLKGLGLTDDEIAALVG